MSSEATDNNIARALALLEHGKSLGERSYVDAAKSLMLKRWPISPADLDASRIALDALAPSKADLACLYDAEMRAALRTSPQHEESEIDVPNVEPVWSYVSRLRDELVEFLSAKNMARHAWVALKENLDIGAPVGTLSECPNGNVSIVVELADEHSGYLKLVEIENDIRKLLYADIELVPRDVVSDDILEIQLF